MTRREFLMTIINSNIDAQAIAYAQAELEKMDATNEKRKNTPSKTAIANAPLLDQILSDILGLEPMTASDVAAVLNVSVQKASALLRQLAESGKVAVTEVKLPKKGAQKGYALVG